MSADPNKLFDTKFIDAVSMSTDITSSSYDIGEVQGYSAQAVWTAGGAPVGNFVLRGSNNGTDFTDIGSYNVAGNTGSILVNVEFARYAYLQCFYQRTSGTGTLTVQVNGARN